MYRRGGRESKLIKELIGKASQGMTVANANLIRSERMANKVSCALYYTDIHGFFSDIETSA